MATMRVVVVGGGTAGWMTAAYLRKGLSSDVSITVIESPNVGRIGVGEATFSTLHLFFRFLGLDEREWMPQCGATYKSAIKFVDWNAEKRSFFHPFQRYTEVEGHSLAEWWLRSDRRVAFDRACFVTPYLCDASRAPRFFDGDTFCEAYESEKGQLSHVQSTKSLTLQFPYGYHFDAQRLADFLSGYAVARGVSKLEDDVVDIIRSDEGALTTVRCRTRGDVAGDLFIDCTGFKGLLINRALGEPFKSFGRQLLCDRAVAIQADYASSSDIDPYTTATALSAGWVWNIPLQTRRGTGYVYCSGVTSPEEAEAELRAHLGKVKTGVANHIQMRVGRTARAWVSNCVAIGLSAGFVEPLESTGIFFIQHGVQELLRYFPCRTPEPADVQAYNASLAGCMEGVRQFLTLHYAAATRNDTDFWRAAKELVRADTELSERMALWRHRLPTAETIPATYHGFESYSYSVMLLGLGAVPKEAASALGYRDSGAARAEMARVRARADMLSRALPSHSEFLRRNRSAAVA